MKKKEEKKALPEAKPFLQPITDTLEQNYMPYAMSVIISRAIPEIDGFKPSHRKLLYTMYKMGLLTGKRTKSANVVGQTMKLNPHGDMAIYETLVRLSRGYEALLHPYVDSKGNFGKSYSRDMAFAASRYTEVKLDPLCAELFSDIDKDTVDFADNYDNTLKEPTLLPTTFPNILTNANTGIAVGMASSICSFNLKEVCKTAAELIKNPDHEILTTLLAPDFSTGGELIFSRAEMEEIYGTGRGSFKVRAKYEYDEKNNCIDVKEIPYTTTVEAVIDKIVELCKGGKIKEIADVRDETDLSGLKLTIDLKRGVDPHKLMARLFKSTPLMDSFSCNFNILIAGTPVTLGIRDILNEWTAFRAECLRRSIYFDLQRKKERLHLLTGLNKILLDIDRAIKIIRETEEEDEVVPNLMIGFRIDERQAEFIAEIKLRNLNRKYILKALEDTEKLKAEIAEMTGILESKQKLMKIILSQLEGIAKKYGAERKTAIVYHTEIEEPEAAELVEDYPVNLFLTREGYFKKITPLSLRMGGEHRFKEGDEIRCRAEGTNRSELLFFTNKQQAYKARAHDFEDTKASALGDFLPVKLKFDEGEYPVFMAVTTDYEGFMIFVYKDGHMAKVPLSSFATKSNRKKLTGAFCEKLPIAAMFAVTAEQDLLIKSTAGKYLCVNTALVPVKPTRTTQGVTVMSLRGKNEIEEVYDESSSPLPDIKAYKSRSLPASGYAPKAERADGGQTTLME